MSRSALLGLMVVSMSVAGAASAAVYKCTDKSGCGYLAGSHVQLMQRRSRLKSIPQHQLKLLEPRNRSQN